MPTCGLEIEGFKYSFNLCLDYAQHDNNLSIKIKAVQLGPPFIEWLPKFVTTSVTMFRAIRGSRRKKICVYYGG